MKNRIVMIGSGYVGLVSGACLADAGHDVVCVDRDPARIRSLSDGDVPFFEPGLEELVRATVKAGRLSFTTDLAAAIRGADAAFITVGTPPRQGDGEADVSQVLAVAEDIAHCLDGFLVVVNKSTVPAGMAETVETLIRQINPDADFAVVSNPEFLREGTAIADFRRPDRVVIGSRDERARDVMRSIYSPLVADDRLFIADRTTAELVKYAANGFLAVKLSYINEMADLCEAVGADIELLARGIGLDGRIGESYLRAGPGYGGSCFPKDTLALASSARRHHAPLRLVETTIEVNEERKLRMADKVAVACGGVLVGSNVGIFGLTFKPDTDDMREAPALVILAELMRRGAKVTAHDPVGMEQARRLLPGTHFVETAEEVAVGADAVVLMTEWECYRSIDYSALHGLMRRPAIVDFRNVLPADKLAGLGFEVHQVGKPPQGGSERTNETRCEPVARTVFDAIAN